MTASLWLIASFVIAISYWLEEHTKWISHISGIMLIIIIASLLGSAGFIPSAIEQYSIHFNWMVPLGIILMLLAFNPKAILKIKKDYIICFIIGTLATAIGSIIAGILFHKILPNDYWRVSGQLAASFVGGYENAVSVGTGLHTPADIFLQTFAGDSVLTTAWIIVNIFQGRNCKPKEIKKTPDESNQFFSLSLDMTSLLITITIACGVLVASSYLYYFFPFLPQILWASLIATSMTFTPLKERFSGSYIFGSILLSFFIFGCGAVSNIPELFNNANILLIIPSCIILIHGIILFSIARLFKIQKEIIIVTSQCLIGGPATALSVVGARKWDCQFEAITLGLLGYAIGNYVGFGVAWILK